MKGPDDCWIWGKLSPGRYGSNVTQSGKYYVSHRASYALNVGPVPAGMFVCHKCDNPPCVNPAHLFLGTPEDNVHDRDKKGRTCKTQGEERWNSKLTEAQVMQIRKDYHEDTQYGLARKYNVTRGAIWEVVMGRNWKHLPLGDNQRNRNKKRNHLVTYNGRTQCIAEWAREIGIGKEALRYRLSVWDVETSLTTTIERNKQHPKKKRP